MSGQSNLPTPNVHCEVLYRQTFNTLGAITAAGLQQNNRVGNAQKVANTRLTSSTNAGILAGSVVAVAGSGFVGPCAGDSTVALFDAALGIAVNDAVGNPFESSSAVASKVVVYAHGTGTVLDTDIYETTDPTGVTPIVYNPGDKLYASQNGLLTNAAGMRNPGDTSSNTLIGIVLQAPVAGTNPFMTLQLRV